MNTVEEEHVDFDKRFDLLNRLAQHILYADIGTLRRELRLSDDLLLDAFDAALDRLSRECGGGSRKRYSDVVRSRHGIKSDIYTFKELAEREGVTRNCIYGRYLRGLMYLRHPARQRAIKLHLRFGVTRDNPELTQAIIEHFGDRVLTTLQYIQNPESVYPPQPQPEPKQQHSKQIRERQQPVVSEHEVLARLTAGRTLRKHEREWLIDMLMTTASGRSSAESPD